MRNSSTLVRSLRRHWLIAGLLFAWVVGAMVAFSLLSPNVYRSTATVFLSNRDLAGALTGLNAQSQEPAATEAQIAELPSVVDEAKRSLGDPSSATARAARVRAEIPSSPNAWQESSLLLIKVDSTDEGYSGRLATAVAQRYVAFRNDLATRDARISRQDVADRLRDLEERGQSGGPLYAQLAGRLQTLDTLIVFGGARAQLLEPAGRATQVAPQPARAGVQGALLGVVVVLLTVLLVDRLNLRVRSVSEISESLALPVLGRLPSPQSRDGRPSFPALMDPTSLGAESFRALRAHVRLALAPRRGHRILVTSSSPGEGKSFVAANLAVTAAAGGQDVLLVDLDLRRPSLHRYLDLPRVPGVTDAIAGDHPIADGIYDIPVPGDGGGRLRFLAAGRPAPNPGEVVASPVLSDMLAKLSRDEYSLLIVDTPPLLAVSDATSLVGGADASVIVARAGKVTRRDLARMGELLRQGGHEPLGVVVTSAPQSRADYKGYEMEPYFPESGAAAKSPPPRAGRLGATAYGEK